MWCEHNDAASQKATVSCCVDTDIFLLNACKSAFWCTFYNSGTRCVPDYVYTGGGYSGSASDICSHKCQYIDFQKAKYVLLEYEEFFIKVDTEIGTINVNGYKLTLEQITSDDIGIKGIIKNINIIIMIFIFLIEVRKNNIRSRFLIKKL